MQSTTTPYFCSMGHRTDLFAELILFAAGTIFLDLGILADDTSTESSAHISLNGSVSPRLIYGESHGISWTDLAVNERLEPLLSMSNLYVIGLDYHYSKSLLFYSAQDTIWRLSFNTLGAVGSPEKLVTNVEGVTNIAVDWTKDRIYWMTPEVGCVHRVNTDGSQREVLLNFTDSVKFSSRSNIVIDPYSRLLFLATDGNRFIRSNINGGRVTFVGPEGLRGKRVVSLAIDRVQRRLYISSIYDYVPHISSYTYDGIDTQEYDLSNAWWYSFMSIDVFGDQLFWIHAGPQERDSVWKANVSSNGSISWKREYTVRELTLGIEWNIWNLKVYHPEVQRGNRGRYVPVVGTDRTPPAVQASSSCNSSNGLFMLVTCIITLHSMLQSN